MSRIHRGSFSIFIGLSGIALGVFYLAKSFGYLNGIELTDYWPLLLIIFGTSRIIKPRSSSSYFWGPVFVVVGALFMVRNLHYLPLDPVRFWPVLLIVFGLWTLARPLFGVNTCSTARVRCGHGFTHRKWHYRTWAADSVLSDNELDISLVMSSGKYICTGKDFKGGSIHLRAASAEIDLTNVETALDEIPLDVDLRLGGIELRIPQNWVVNYLGKTSLGSVQDHTRQGGGPAKKLLIGGEVALAGIEIRN